MLSSGGRVVFTEETWNLKTVTRSRHHFIYIYVSHYVYRLMGVFCVTRQHATARLAKTKADIAKQSSYLYLSCCQKPCQMYFLSRFFPLLIVLGIHKFGKLDYCAISYDCNAATVAHSICSSFELFANESHDLFQAKKRIHKIRMTIIFPKND